MSELFKALDEPFSKLADNSPVFFVMVITTTLLIWNFNKSIKVIKSSYDEARKDIKENNEKTLELMKEFYESKKSK